MMKEMMKLYLANPFQTRHETREWELETEELTGIELFNPFYDAPGRFDVKAIDKGDSKRYENLDYKALVGNDLYHLIVHCDGLLGIIDGSTSYGTIMEITYAWLFGVHPIFLLVTNGHHEHPWLRYHSDEIVTTPKDMQTLLQAFKEGEH